MRGRVVRRVAEAPLGMWTEVHFPNGDRVMVSLAKDGLEISKISRWGAVFGRERLGRLEPASLAAFAATSSTRVRDQLVATGAFDKDQASAAVLGSVDLSILLDTITSFVCLLDGAEDVKRHDFADLLARASGEL